MQTTSVVIVAISIFSKCIPNVCTKPLPAGELVSVVADTIAPVPKPYFT